MTKSFGPKANYTKEESERIFLSFSQMEMVVNQLDELSEVYSDIDYREFLNDAKKLKKKLREKYNKINPRWAGEDDYHGPG